MPKRVNIERSVLEHLYVDQGKSLAEVASVLGCSRATVANYVRRYGLDTNRTGKVGRRRVSISEEELRESYVREGMHLGELTGAFSCSESLVSARIREWGLREERDAFLDARIAEMAADGMSQSRMARELRIGRDQVARRMRDMGLATSVARDAAEPATAKRGIGTSPASRWRVSDAPDTTAEPVGRRPAPDAADVAAGSETAPATRTDNEWEDWVKSLGVAFERDVPPAPGADAVAFYLPDIRLGIDLAHTGERSVDIPQADGTTLSRRHHLRQSSIAEAVGSRIIRAYDWEDADRLRDVVASSIGRGERIHARKTEIVPVPRRDEQRFLAENHLRGYVRSSVCYGLVDEEGRLVSVMSFCPPRYGNTDGADWELLRLCSLSGTRVAGGASKLFSRFVEDHRPGKVMSYCDYDISVGGVYEALGFSLVRHANPSYTWVMRGDPTEHRSWALVNAVGYDRMFGTSHGKGTSNTELMLGSGYVRVYNAGNKVYVWDA